MALKKNSKVTKSAAQGGSAQANLVVPSTFHSIDANAIGQRWDADIDALERLLATAVATGAGLDEKTLVDWFGASVERISLLAFAVHGFMPSFVAREMTLSNFRADFAWIILAENKVGTSTVCFAEMEGALPDTLFRQSTRSYPYYGAKFLDGFSQLVDWCSFGHGEAVSHPKVSVALKGTPPGSGTAYQYCLVAGLDHFLDAHTKGRLAWWRDNVKIGHGTSYMTFSEVVEIASFRRKNLKSLYM
ncbi:hypothetical protein [Stenotrophomonas sp. MH181796]|uniref:hypothetical protein n=1 Tax=Stenotrophomonas sp. MH181796 TaxID=2339228 RepID=UPI00129CCF98|nr:hypothetical protein [Stenotrophomonas sp. MH181796]